MTRYITSALIAPIAFAGFAFADVENPPPAEDASGETPSAWMPEDGDVIAFEVLRKGKAFGSHEVSFDVESEGNFTATSKVSLKAGLGPITVFKYDLDAQETWEDGDLVALDGETNDDGDDEFVNASLEGEELTVEGSAYSGAAPVGIIPSSHWNIGQVFSDRILSTETGELIEVQSEKLGRETLEIGGETIEADHYRLNSDLVVDIWYDDQSRWVKLAFEARGQQIEYVLNELY